MRVRAVKAFGGSGHRHDIGDEFDLPKGVDWLKAGLVEEIKPAAKKTTTRRKPRKKAE